ncbi:mitochondrial import inner membrane translocase subunit Tim21-like [Oncorhynchus masou masou]|uniref:mitochondrial import inner membrane translocase subunit Tim21-like n=1 Tax=Oncorhynchus masou masou TaxID=90313 RepID=UPI0031839889
MQNSVHLQKPTTAPSRYIFYRTADRSAIVSAIFCTQNRSISLDTRLRSKEENDGGQVSVYRRGPSTAHKFKEAGKDLTYLIVVLIGLGVTGGLLYVVFQELFSSSSPNKVYSKAFNEARLHPENPETGKLEFRYIFVEVDTYPRRTIVIVDNR